MRRFGHVQHRPVMGSVRKRLVIKVDGPPRGRSGPKRMWMEVVRIDIKKYDLSEDLAQDRSE